MLSITRELSLRDHLRSFQAMRRYGLQVSKNYRAIQWHGAFAPSNRGIVYFIARRIDDQDTVKESYEIATDRIKYEKGQYLYDKTKLFDGILPSGTFFFEIQDSWEKYFSSIFIVNTLPEPLMCSSELPCSSELSINTLTVQNTSGIYLRQFDFSGPYYQFENL